MSLTPNECAAIERMRAQRPQGFVCDDGLVRCLSCAREYRAQSVCHTTEAYTPRLGDGDDWCSACDADIRARQ